MAAESPPLIVHWHLEPAFPLSENWLYRQFEGLRAYRYLFYTLGRVHRDIFPSQRIRALNECSMGLRSLNRLYRVFREDFLPFRLWLRRDRPAIVHAHFGTDGYWAMRHITDECILVVSFYGRDAYIFDHDPQWLGKYRRMFSRGAIFLAEGPAMAAKLVSLGCPAKKVRVHPVGIQTGQYRFSPRRFSPGDEIRLLVVGRFVEKKGIPYAVRALALVRKKHPRATLTIVGEAADNADGRREKSCIESAIRETALEPHVRLAGWLSPPKLLELADSHHVLLVPSVTAADGDAEGGHPVFLTEMLASGMPVAAFDHCDARQAVVDGHTGLLVPMRDCAGLADAVGRFIADAQGRERMCAAARHHAEELYDIRRLNDKLEGYYGELLGD